jgi:rod shape-determining protein MreC
VPSTMDHQHPPAFFVRGPSPLARLTFFAAVSIALMAVDARLHYLTEIRQGVSVVLHPLEVAVRAPVNAFLYVSDYITTQTNLVHENRQLRQRALLDSADLQRFRTLQAENAHLRNMLSALPAMPQPARLGEIVNSGRDPFNQKVIVNLGARHGIAAGQAVIDELGVIGQATQVYPFSSEVTLVTDKDLAVPVQIERSGLRAIAFGNSRDALIDLPYLPVNVDIQVGDRLVTSGIDGVYPAGLAVGKVVEIDRKTYAPFARITCVPIAGIQTHRQVLLIPAAENVPPPPEPEKPAAKPSEKNPRNAPRKP